MKRLFIALAFGAAMFFGLQHYQPSFATELVTLGNTQVAWGWIVIAGSALLGFILSGKK